MGGQARPVRGPCEARAVFATSATNGEADSAAGSGQTHLVLRASVGARYLPIRLAVPRARPLYKGCILLRAAWRLLGACAVSFELMYASFWTWPSWRRSLVGSWCRLAAGGTNQ